MSRSALECVVSLGADPGICCRYRSCSGAQEKADSSFGCSPKTMTFLELDLPSQLTDRGPQQ